MPKRAHKEIPSKNIQVYESLILKLEVSLVWSLTQRGRRWKTMQEKCWQRRTAIEVFNFVLFSPSTAKRESAFSIHLGLLHHRRPGVARMPWNNRCDQLVKSEQCGKKYLQVTIRDVKWTSPPKIIPKHTFFLTNILLSINHLSLEVDSVMVYIKYWTLKYAACTNTSSIFHIQGTQKKYESLCLRLSHQGFRTVSQYMSTCVCTVSRCNSVGALVYTSQNTHIYHKALHLRLCSTCLNMEDFTRTLILVFAHFL